MPESLEFFIVSHSNYVAQWNSADRECYQLRLHLPFEKFLGNTPPTSDSHGSHAMVL